MNNPTALNPKSSLRDNYLRTKVTARSTPTTATGSYTPPQDLLYHWLQHDVRVTFLSGRTLQGDLTILTRYTVGVVDGEGMHCVPKHAIEQVCLAVQP